MRIAHLSDIHLWQYTINPLRLLSKRSAGMASLFWDVRRRFRLERIPDLVDRVNSLRVDHILITGDLTTTALPDEFRAARSGPVRLAGRPVPLDRHSRQSRPLHTLCPPITALRALFRRVCTAEGISLAPLAGRRDGDPRSRPDAIGNLRERQDPSKPVAPRREIIATAGPIARLLVACHYPVAVPEDTRENRPHKPLINRGELAEWLGSIGPHLYCCGHVHAAWAYQPDEVPGQLCLNPGCPCSATGPACGLPVFSRSRSREAR